MQSFPVALFGSVLVRERVGRDKNKFTPCPCLDNSEKPFGKTLFFSKDYNLCIDTESLILFSQKMLFLLHYWVFVMYRLIKNINLSTFIFIFHFFKNHWTRHSDILTLETLFCSEFSSVFGDTRILNRCIFVPSF